MKESLRKKIYQSVSFILTTCLEKGEVYIVTNSKEGWVKYSSEMFLPKTLKTIFEINKIKVISTRPSN
jgi:hypothetical protein